MTLNRIQSGDVRRDGNFMLRVVDNDSRSGIDIVLAPEQIADLISTRPVQTVAEIGEHIGKVRLSSIFTTQPSFSVRDRDKWFFETHADDIEPLLKDGYVFSGRSDKQGGISEFTFYKYVDRT